jgi:inosine-uridine nucleoside N-ribohydrolase
VLPQAISTRSVYVDVETRGEITRGMSIIDARPSPAQKPNVEMVTNVEVNLVRKYIFDTLRNVEAADE